MVLDDVYKRDLESRTSLTEGISAVENMNASGDIVGILRHFNPSPNFAGPNRVFLFRNGKMTNLGAPTTDGFNLAVGYGQSGVLQINNSDQVLAGNEFFSGRSWIIDLKSGQWIRLTPDGSDWAARGLNDLGEVVGQYTKSKKGAIWSGGVLREIPNNPGKSAGFNSPLYIGNDGRIIWSSGHVTDRDGNVQQTLRPTENIGIFASHNIKITGQNIVMYPPGDSNFSLWKGADYVTYNGQLRLINASYYPYLPNSVPSLMFSDIDDSGRLLASWFGIMTPSVPLILDQPQTVRVREGAAASLSITVAGALINTRGDGIFGAWHRDATEPEGKVSLVWRGDSVTCTNRLTIAAVRIQHAGDYYFVATNVSGVVTSAVARIEVISPPRITRQPDDVTGLASSTVGFSVEASGVPAPDYQWRHNGIDLPGETGASLTVSNVGLNSAGDYSVVVRNSEGSLVSRNALLTVKSLPSRRIVVAQAPGDAPGSLTVLIQASAQGNENALTFSLAFDPARLTYISTALGSGATGANFIANVNQAQSGQLGVVISLPAGQSLSAGSLDLLQVRFAPVGTPGKVPITFAKTPAPISISDVLGNDLVCEFVDGSVGTAAGLSPTIENVRRDGDTLSATLTGFSAGATVILQKSSNLRDWADAQTFTASGGSISIQRPIQSNEEAEYLRFLVR
ncbi:MAG: hypothetical protein EXS30_11375 [Pedosphaera sp.]|nr:hypothetical protein [Pedosphaera sp.]